MALSNNPTTQPDGVNRLAAQRLVDAGSWFARQGLLELESAVADLSPELDLLLWSHLANAVPIVKAASDAGLATSEAEKQLQPALEVVAQTLRKHGWGELTPNDVAVFLRIAGSLVDKPANADTLDAKLPVHLRDQILLALQSAGDTDRLDPDDRRHVDVEGQLAAVALPIGRGATMETFVTAPDPVDALSNYLQLVHAYEDDIVQPAEEAMGRSDRYMRLLFNGGRTLDVPLHLLHDRRDAGVFEAPHFGRASESSAVAESEGAEVEIAEVSVLYELSFEHGTLVFAQRGGDLLIRLDSESPTRTS